MENRLEDLERRVEALTRTVESLAARVEAMSASPTLSPPKVVGADEPTPSPSSGPGAARSEAWATVLPSIGRSFLGVGGAFLIRALTERRVVPPAVGVGLGIGFAGLWILLSWRAARRNLAVPAAFHAATGGLVAFPLLVETASGSGGAVRLAIISGTTAAVTLTAFFTLMLAVAWHARHRLTAWLAVGGGAITATLLLLRAGAPIALTAALLAMSSVTLVLAEARQWPKLRWPLALLLDFVVLRGAFSAASRTELAPQLTAAVLLAQVSALLFLAALVVRTWWRKANIGPFEVAQTALAGGVGVATAARVESLLGSVTLVVASCALVLACGAALSAARCSDRPNHGIDVWFYGTLALALVLSGGLLLSRGPLVTTLWAALALATAVLGRRTRTTMLWLFSAVLGVAAAVSGNLLSLLTQAFVSPAERPVELAPEPLLVLAAVAACWLAAGTGTRADTRATDARAAVSPLLVLASLGFASLVVSAVRWALGPEPASVVLARTLVLVAAALGLGAARRVGPAELAWVAWVMLGAAGLKLLVQDLPLSNASTLFVSFLVFGGAVIVLPRLIRGRRLGRASS